MISVLFSLESTSIHVLLFTRSRKGRTGILRRNDGRTHILTSRRDGCEHLCRGGARREAEQRTTLAVLARCGGIKSRGFQVTCEASKKRARRSGFTKTPTAEKASHTRFSSLTSTFSRAQTAHGKRAGATVPSWFLKVEGEHRCLRTGSLSAHPQLSAAHFAFRSPAESRGQQKNPALPSRLHHSRSSLAPPCREDAGQRSADAGGRSKAGRRRSRIPGVHARAGRAPQRG